MDIGDAIDDFILPSYDGYQVGTEVNIEVDLLARYIERLLGTGDESAITKEFLRAHGYA